MYAVFSNLSLILYRLGTWNTETVEIHGATVCSWLYIPITDKSLAQPDVRWALTYIYA